MNETRFQLIWKYLYFGFSNLLSQNGKLIEIVHPGFQNFDAGPDFLRAKIKIDGNLLKGDVELHPNGNDWYAHKHHLDKNYNNVILHVVLEKSTKPILTENQKILTELIIQPKIPKEIQNKLEQLENEKNSIACRTFLPEIPQSFLNISFQSHLVKRFEQKMQSFIEIHAENNSDLEQSVWIFLAKTFGLTKNTEQFQETANILSFKLLKKYAENPKSQEALIYGVSGLLENKQADDYHQNLQEEWQFLKAKHNSLKEIPQKLQFFRMRPTNFPSIRLAQLLELFRTYDSLTAWLSDFDADKFFKHEFKLPEYWKQHYNFGKTSKNQNSLGKQFKTNILINFVIPIRIYFSQHDIISSTIEEILEDLTLLKPEKNQIITKFEEIGLKPKNAQESQAMIELFKNYCKPRNCLKCSIGQKILRKTD